MRRPSRRRSRGICTVERAATMADAVAAAARAARPGRHGAAVSGLREPRHVPRLRASRRRIRRRRARTGEAPMMNTTTMGYGVRARERMPFAWDGVTLGIDRRAPAGGSHHGDVRLHVGGREGSGRSVLFPGAPVHLRMLRGAGGAGRDPRADGAVGEAQRHAAAAGSRAAGARAHSGARREDQRRTPLAAHRSDELPGFGARASAGAQLGLQLLRAQARRTRARVLGTAQARGAARRRGRAAADRTRFRRDHGAVRDRVCGAVRRRGAAALCVHAGVGGGSRCSPCWR